jgi:PD-(D/E)XK nuclease superfamily
MTSLLSFDSTGAQFAWDSTSLTAFATCPRKYFYSNLQGWTSELRSVHLIFGGHYATALEHFHKHRAAGFSHEDAQRMVVRETLEATWDREAGKPQDWLHASKTRDTLIRSIVWYLENYKDDPMKTVILSNGKPAVEYSFSVPLNDEYVYCGHIDRLVEYGDANDIYVQDQKTSGAQITKHFFDKFSPDYQMTGYTWSGQIIFNMPVKGVVVDAAYIAVGFTDFGRGYVGRNMPQLEEFREEVLHYIGLAKHCHETGYYPMNRTACGNFGGCEFQKVCSSVPGVRKNLLEGGFKKRDRWDPLRRR